MTSYISRTADLSSRVFPEIQETLYEAREHDPTLSAAQSAAMNLLLTEPCKLTKLQRYLGINLNGTSAVARLVLFHREAFLAEQAGQFRRADYFWEEFYSQLNSRTHRDNFWQKLASYFSAAGAAELTEPLKARARFLQELVIDTHAAIFNGYARTSEELESNSRAWIHLSYLEKVSELSDLSFEQRRQLTAAAVEAHIEILASAKKWNLVAWEMAKVLRSELQAEGNSEGIPYDLRVKLSDFRKAKRPKKGSLSTTQLQLAINVITEVWEHFILNQALFHRLAMLHDHLAQALAERGEVCMALAAVEKALTFNPNSSAASITKAKLESTMADLQERAPNVSSGTRLGSDGPFLLDEARVGFRLVDEYKESLEAAQISMAREIARARVLWRKIASSDLERDQIEVVLKLITTLDSLVTQPFPSEADFTSQWWSQIAADHELLKDLDPTAVYEFLLTEQSATGEPDEKRVLSVEHVPPPSSKPRQVREPFTYWLFARSDFGLKAQAMVLILVFMVMAALVIKDGYARSVRQESYHRLIQASNNHDYAAVMENAEAFLSHSIVVSDKRDDEVMERYNQALVRWIARQQNVNQPDVAMRIQRYRELVRK